jgi:hypothetical protein
MASNPNVRSTNVTLVQLVDHANDRKMELDAVDNALQAIAPVHHEIHEGKHFTVAVLDRNMLE